MMKKLLAIVVVAMMTASCASLGKHNFRIVTEDQTYVFVWACVSEALPCYQEVLRVLEILPNGWLIVSDQRGQLWYANPAQAIAITPNIVRPVSPARPVAE